MISEVKGTSSVSRMVFLDTETTKHEDGLDYLRLGWMDYWDGGKDKWIYFTAVEQFWEELEKVIGKRKRPIFIYGYNVRFDYQVLGLMKHISRLGWTYLRPPIISDRLFIFQASFQGSTVWFLDMGNHVGGLIPLKKIGERMNILKGDLPRNKLDDYPDEEVSKYCKRDVEIVRNYVLEWFRFLADNDLGIYKPSLAGQCLTAYRHRFIEQPIYVHTIPHIVALERSSYRGGRLEAFWIGKRDDVYKLDVNSFHPYIMSTFPLPYRLVAYRENPKNSFLNQLLSKNYAFIASCYLWTNRRSRLIPVRKVINHEETNIYPIGTFHAVITSVDYLRLIRFGGKVFFIDKLAIYKQNVLFKKYIDFFYQKRTEFKETGNYTMDQMAKYMMNSLEGKFAQRTEQLIHFTDDPDFDHHYYMSDMQTRICVYVFDGKGYIKSPIREEGWNTFVPTSSFIRAYTRTISWEDIMDIRKHGGSVFYMDTDSLFCDDAGFSRLMERGRVDEKKLGAYKLEETGSLTVIGAKEYIFNGKRKAKGIRQDAIEVSPRVFRQIRFETMKSMLRRGITEGVRINESFLIDKSKSIYKQGIPPEGGTGWVEPYHLDE